MRQEGALHRMLELAALAAIILLFTGAGGQRTQAAGLTNSSLLLSDPRPSETNITYTMNANGFSAGAQCIVLELDSAADGSGGVPAGLNSTGAVLDASGTMITESNWTLDASTNGSLELTYATGETPSSGTLVLTGIDNGSSEGVIYFGIFDTYADTGCSSSLDSVVVAFTFREGEQVSLSVGPELTFTTNAVASGQSVNGATTSVTSGGSSIDFGTLTASVNGVSAHDLAVATNAPAGYTVYIRHSGNLQNSGGNTLDSHSGTNTSPTAFPAAGSEAWGYTTEDASLSGVTPDRFTSSGGNKWAGFSTVNAEVIYNASAPVGIETTRVGHQVGIAASTAAGSYQTTIIYTIAATY